MIDIRINGGTLPQEEIDAYIRRGQEKYPNRELEAMDILVDGDYVELKYHFKNLPFDRIRRITGYLVGTTERFNNAKQAEEKDRVKHTV